VKYLTVVTQFLKQSTGQYKETTTRNTSNASGSTCMHACTYTPI